MKTWENKTEEMRENGNREYEMRSEKGADQPWTKKEVTLDEEKVWGRLNLAGKGVESSPSLF